MKIGNEYLYVGAYAERLHDRKIERRKRPSPPSPPSKCPDHILGPDGKQRAVVKMEISLKGQTMYDLSKKERYKGLDFEDCGYSDQIESLKQNTNVQNDPFAMNPCNEWITFSEFLYQNHYFDQMNEEEVKDFEEKFMHITNGMDEFNVEHNPHIGGTRCPLCGYDQYKDSLSVDSPVIMPDISSKSIEEETTVLESSIAALQYLSDKLLPASLQDGFNQLIGQYRQHNESLLKDYKPPVLTPEVARMILYSMHSGPLDPPSQDSFYEKATHDFKYLMLRRKISTPYRDTRSYAKLVSDAFHSFCASRNPEVIYQKIKDHYIDFATRGSKDADHSGPLDPPSQDSFYEKATHDFKYLMLRRKISTPYRDTRSYAQLVADTFHSFCASKNPDVIYQKVKDHYIDFATRGSKDAGFYDYISSHELEASTPFEHSTSRLIRECWKNTFALEERYSQKSQ